ncbi:MAG: hypothetical protein J5I47_05185 [Vicingus serpentipes]|nr:hypothetical protein [Vicingus serpentipes]
MKKILSIFILLAITSTTMGQETVFEEARTIYKRESTYGLIIHTRGWGINYRYGQYTSGFTRKTYEGELVGMKHPKEINSFSSIFDNSNGYKYGKLNSLIILRASTGIQNTFISKQSVRGIAIGYVLNIGLSLGYAKPVYLEVVHEDEITGILGSTIEKYDPNKHQQSDIIGKASMFRGFFGGKIYPGVLVKAGLNFESAKQASKINAIEVGGTLDIYFQKIPIMANNLNSPLFYNLYVAISFGSKKTE